MTYDKIYLSAQPMLDALANHPGPVSHTYRKSIRRATKRGTFSLRCADTLACHVLGVHPHAIWGDEYDAAVWHDATPVGVAA